MPKILVIEDEDILRQEIVEFLTFEGYDALDVGDGIAGVEVALAEQPDLILCDGQGLAHPRRFGIACHLGVATGITTIGVAKSILVGGHAPLPPDKGARVPFLIDGEQVGIALRSRTGVKPLIISPGHRIGIAAAADQVLALTTRYRLPEPTRLADRLSRAGKAGA